MNIDDIKIESTRRLNEKSINMFPYSITLKHPEPLLRAYLISLSENKTLDNKKSLLTKNSGAFLDQNSKNFIRLTFKHDPSELLKFIHDDFATWTSRQKRFGLDKGIEKTINLLFNKAPDEKKIYKRRKVMP